MALVYTSLTAVALVYSGWQYVAKAAMNERMLPPIVLALCRCLFGSVVMFSVQATLGLVSSHGEVDLKDSKSKKPVHHRSDFLQFIMLGMLQAVNTSGSIIAVSRLSALTVAIFQPLIPLCAGVMACFLKIEYVSWRQTIGLLLAASGAASVVVLSDHRAAGSGNAFVDDWDAWRLAGPYLAVHIIASAMYIVLHKRPCSTYPPIFVAASSFLIASLPLCLATVVSGSLHHIHWSVFNTTPGVVVIFYAAVLTTAFNYGLVAWATRETSPTTVTSFQTLQPLFAALLLWFVYGTLPSQGQAVGSLQIVIGLFLFTAARPSEPTTVGSEPLQGREAAVSGCSTAYSSTDSA